VADLVNSDCWSILATDVNDQWASRWPTNLLAVRSLPSLSCCCHYSQWPSLVQCAFTAAIAGMLWWFRCYL